MTKKLIIKGGHVVTVDDTLGDLPCGDILIVDGVIARIAPSIEEDDAEIVDATGMIVSPGFVDTHRHVWQTQLRGVATDWSLFEYSVQMRHAYSSSYEPEDAYLGNLVGALEALNAGVTTIVDHSHLQISPEHSDALVTGLMDAGIRGIFCYAMYDNPRQSNGRLELATTADRAIAFHHENARRVRDRYFSGPGDLLRFGVAAAEWSRLDDAAPAVAEIGRLRELAPLRISIHIGMGVNEQVRFVPELARARLLGDDLLFVHGAHLTDGDLALLAQYGGWVSTTPDTELQMGMGYPAAERVVASGKDACLGVDIVSNIGGDMFSQMRLMLQTWRFRDYERDGVIPLTRRYPAANMLRMATLGGATAAGLGKLTGSLTPGKAADIVLTRTDAINMAPLNDAVGALIFYANPSDVDSVFVAGRAVKRRGVLANHIWPDLKRKLEASRDRIVERFERLDLREAAGNTRAAWGESIREAALHSIDPV